MLEYSRVSVLSSTPSGYGLVVKRVLAKDQSGVRFSLSAPEEKAPSRALFLLDEVSS